LLILLTTFETILIIVQKVVHANVVERCSTSYADCHSPPSGSSRSTLFVCPFIAFLTPRLFEITQPFLRAVDKVVHAATCEDEHHRKK